MVLSLLIVLLVAAAAWRGWLRGIYAEAVDLVGLSAVVLVAVAAGRVGGAPAAAVVVAAGSVAVLVLSTRVSRLASTAVRGGLLGVSRVAGSAFAGVVALVLVTGILLLGTTVPTARVRVAGPVCDAPVARYLTVTSHPLHGAGRRLADLAQPGLLWAARHASDAFTLGTPPAVGLCAEVELHRAADGVVGPGRGFTFPAAAADQLAAAPDAERGLLTLLNAARAEAGLPPVVADPALAAVGRAHARDMYLRGFFAHETPECGAATDTPGCTVPSGRVRAAGIDYRTTGENLALAPTVAAAHDGLMASPGHRGNILTADFSRVGIGIVSGPFGVMVTQVFAG